MTPIDVNIILVFVSCRENKRQRKCSERKKKNSENAQFLNLSRTKAIIAKIASVVKKT
jgi:hypothetical protein